MDWIRPVPEPLQRPIRLGVLISGGGTTLLNFLEHMEAGKLAAEIPIVISSQTECRGVDRARAAGLETRVFNRADYLNTKQFSEAIFACLDQIEVDLVTLAGFLALLHVPEAYRLRVMNIHPSLIPAFCGKGFYGHHVHEAVIRRGCRVSGCTVHFADNEYDHGPIISQKSVPVSADATPESLASDVFEQECQAYPEAIRWYAEGRMTISGNRVRIDDASSKIHRSD